MQQFTLDARRCRRCKRPAVCPSDRPLLSNDIVGLTF